MPAPPPPSPSNSPSPGADGVVLEAPIYLAQARHTCWYCGQTMPVAALAVSGLRFGEVHTGRHIAFVRAISGAPAELREAVAVRVPNFRVDDNAGPEQSTLLNRCPRCGTPQGEELMFQGLSAPFGRQAQLSDPLPLEDIRVEAAALVERSFDFTAILSDRTAPNAGDLPAAPPKLHERKDQFREALEAAASVRGLTSVEIFRLLDELTVVFAEVTGRTVGRTDLIGWRARVDALGLSFRRQAAATAEARVRQALPDESERLRRRTASASPADWPDSPPPKK